MAANADVTTPSTARAWLGGASIQRRLSYAFVGAATIALVSAAPGLAKAQGVGIGGGMPPVALGGPAKPLTFGVQERTTYDSNVARGDDTAAALRGLDASDIIYSPSVTVSYASGNVRRGLALQGYVGYDYYQNNDTLRREHIDISAAANTEIGSRCFVGGRVGYDRGQSGLEDLALFITKNTIQTYTVSASETCASSGGLTQSVQVHHSAASNSNDTLVDFDTTGVSASVGYGNRTLGNISLVGNYSKTDYGAPPILAGGTPDGLEVTGVGVQFSRPIGMRLAGNAAVFYSTSHVDLGTVAVPGQKTSFDGLTANVGLTYLVGPRLHLSANLARAIQASIRQGVGFSVNDLVALNADYTVSSRISANLGANWSRQSFRGDNLLFPQLAPDRVELKTLTAGVSMKVGRNALLSGEVQHEESSTDLALFNFSSDRVSLTVSASF